MTIKTRLGLNTLFVTLVVSCVAATSLLGFRFLQGRLALLTQRSTPFQTRTLEFQRDIQAATSDLIQLGDTSAPEDVAANVKAAAASVAEALASQQRLLDLTGEPITAAAELEKLEVRLSSVVSSRLQAQKDAAQASEATAKGLADATARLRALDARVKDLQARQAKLHVSSVEEGQRLSEDLRSIEVLRTTLKDLYLAAGQLRQDPPANWAKGFASLARRATQNGYAKRREGLLGRLQTLVGKIDELSKAAGRPDADAGAGEVARQYEEIMGILEEDSDAGNEKFSDIYGKQKGYSDQAGAGVAALSANSRLVSLGSSVDSLARSCLTAPSSDLDRIAQVVEATYGQIGAAERELDTTLRQLRASGELGQLRSASQSLAGVRSVLLGEAGLVARLRSQAEMAETSRKAMDELRRMVLAQVQKGKQTVSAAQGEQEASIAAVNRVAARSARLIAGIGVLAVLVGLFFGLWTYRAIAVPLASLIDASERVARGELSVSLESGRRDEFGRVMGAMEKMAESLRDMVRRIQAVTQLLASNSTELSATARSLDEGSGQQQVRVEQAAAAASQMSMTTQDVARNTIDTAAAADRVRGSALEGRRSMQSTAERLGRFAEEVRSAAATVEELGEQSNEIGSVVVLIRDVADQTNLLALNAAIEAARAGAQGRGFAVVAESVRQLSEKTVAAVGDIARVVKAMQGGVGRSVAAIQSQRRTVDAVQGDVGQTLAAIDAIASEVGQVSERVQQIAVASEEQARATEDIASGMGEVALVTEGLRRGFIEVHGSSGELSKAAAELEGLVAWFRLEEVETAGGRRPPG